MHLPHSQNMAFDDNRGGPEKAQLHYDMIYAQSDFQNVTKFTQACFRPKTLHAKKWVISL